MLFSVFSWRLHPAIEAIGATSLNTLTHHEDCGGVCPLSNFNSVFSFIHSRLALPLQNMAFTFWKFILFF